MKSDIDPLEPRMWEIDQFPAHNQLSGFIDFVESEVPEKGKYVELGTFRGVSCAALAKLRPDLEIITIDRMVNPEAASRLSPFSNVTVQICDALDFAGTISDGEIDVVYIDTDHDYSSVWESLAKWAPKVVPGGVVAGHDYWKEFQEVIWAVTDFFQNPPTRVYADSSWAWHVPENNEAQ
ncbi:MAG: class I SAM-dependent methyltransferase [Verrucomicrobiales bacterium]|nr:class I SAM-dependent methyltransferase [Verrucomicrobiales bacterium]